MRIELARIAYGLAFSVVIPGLLIALSLHLDRSLTLPMPFPPWLGAVPLPVGLALVAGGLVSIRAFAGVWPMNAFPPDTRVERGLYGLVPHPIYIGFSLACFGAAVCTQSGAGLLIIWPLATLAALSLYWGYERQDLDRRFGGPASPLLCLPAGSSATPTVAQRLTVYLFVLIPWAIVYELLARLPTSRALFIAAFEFERTAPTLDIFAIPYLAAYPWTVLAPLLAKGGGELRRFAIAGATASIIGFLLYIGVPAESPFRTPDGNGVLGWLIAVQQALDSAMTSLPAFHVVWPMLAADLYAARWTSRKTPIRIAVWTMIASCWFTGMHSILDIAGGLALYCLVRSPEHRWRLLCRWAERTANSWREWHIGATRVISHGLYAGLAALIGFLIVAGLAGTERTGVVAIVFISGVVAAGIWEKLWIPTSRLSRPFGYFGGLVGCSAACASLVAMEPSSGWPVAAAAAVAAPAVQIMGRVRCLMQGCCHGRPAVRACGIRYRCPQSRVSFMTEYQDRELHATPVYSILANAACALVLFRLVWEQASCGLICGTYLATMGIARFAEEAWRGEPETPIVRGLRLYQWFAMASVVAGLVLIAMPSPAFAASMDLWSPLTLAYAALAGLIAMVALGVDFPSSTRRFSRLS